MVTVTFQPTMSQVHCIEIPIRKDVYMRCIFPFNQCSRYTAELQTRGQAWTRSAGLLSCQADLGLQLAVVCLKCCFCTGFHQLLKLCVHSWKACRHMGPLKNIQVSVAEQQEHARHSMLQWLCHTAQGNATSRLHKCAGITATCKDIVGCVSPGHSGGALATVGLLGAKCCMPCNQQLGFLTMQCDETSKMR